MVSDNLPRELRLAGPGIYQGFYPVFSKLAHNLSIPLRRPALGSPSSAGIDDGKNSRTGASELVGPLLSFSRDGKWRLKAFNRASDCGRDDLGCLIHDMDSVGVRFHVVPPPRWRLAGVKCSRDHLCTANLVVKTEAGIEAATELRGGGAPAGY